MAAGTGIVIGILAAAGIIVIVGIITISVIKEKLRSKGDFFLATIKKRQKQLGVPVVHVDLTDLYGNSIDELKLASLDGDNVSIGQKIYKNEL